MDFKQEPRKYVHELLNGELLSVVIPAYNREDTIRDTLISVLKQTYLPDEVIVVDDGSTDKTVEIIQRFAENCDLVKVICYCQKNSGAQVARNKGIELATGEWIAFLDSDDLWMPDKLEQQAKALQKIGYEKNTVVHGNCVVRNLKTGEQRVWILPFTDGEDVYVQLLERPAPTFPAILTSKKALVDAGLLDEKVPAYQEWDTSIRLSQRCRFIHIEKALFEYFIHDTAFRNPRRDFSGYEYIVKKYLKIINMRCGWKILKKHIEILAQKCIYAGEYNKLQDIENMIPTEGAITEKNRRIGEYYLHCAVCFWENKDTAKSQELYRKANEMYAFSGEIDAVLQKEKGKHVYLYGNGKYGKIVYKFFVKNGIQLQGIIISDGYERHEELFDVPVKNISELDIGISGNIYLACDERYHEEILEEMDCLYNAEVYTLRKAIIDFMMLSINMKIAISEKRREKND